MKVRLAIFASGSGTNAENIIRYFRDSSMIEVALVMTDKSEAYVLKRANDLQVPSVIFSKKEMEATESVLTTLADCRIDFIVLAGFLLRIPENMLKAFPGRIVNIHPALLPRYGGKGMYGGKVHEAVVAAGETESGITIHYVNERYDEGAVIFQATCPVQPDDSPGDLAKKVHALEYAYFPEVIEKTIVRDFRL